MKSPVVKRSIVVAGHKTSVSLEEAFWNGMKEISSERDLTLSELVGEIDGHRQQGNLSSAIRLFVLDYFRQRANGNGHVKLNDHVKSGDGADKAAQIPHQENT
ncbi:MAG: ribbon-helix-helix domain-containing protein [Pseudomonadota bacterium]|jgi:predicted DNA-binding ribbon-helix-helix protein